MAKQRDPGQLEKELDTIYERFITPAERRRRIEVAAKKAGYKNMHQLATDIGVRRSTLMQFCVREQVSVKSLYKIALKLGVSMNYLTERSG